MTTAVEMRRSWLVQRLEKPLKSEHPFFGKDNPFSFGGGLKNGGLSDEAMGLLRGIFRFDYMGAAEFEFGAVPRALSAIAKATLTAFTVSVPLAAVPKHWRDKSKTQPDGAATIYVLCPEQWAIEVAGRIVEWARADRPDLKEGLRLTSALRPLEEWDRDICGWLELDNGFLFFTDEEMWKQTCSLFEVEAK